MQYARRIGRLARVRNHQFVWWFTFGLFLTMVKPSIDIHAQSCPVDTTLIVTDAQDGFAGKTGATWTVRPDCTFTVVHFVGTKAAEPQQQGQLTPEQKRRLAGLLARDVTAGLPAQVGEATPVNSRHISLKYGGKVVVLAMSPGDSDVPAILSAEVNDPKRRLFEFASALKDMLGG